VITEAKVFPYGVTETSYLSSRDPRLGEVMGRLGHIDRALDTDLSSAVVHHIVSQQISNAALATVWGRMQRLMDNTINAPHVIATGTLALQACGMSHRKATYICDFAERVDNGSFDLKAVERMDDAEAIATLRSLRGIGTWTAEMILLFSLARPNILAFDDLAIQRGMRMVYHHRAITPKIFEQHRRRLSPYGSTASIYFWAVSAGALPDLKDWAPQAH